MNADQGIGCNNNGLSDKAARKLITLVEYYFSDLYLATTDILTKFIFKDPEGFVPISVVASFKMIKPLISSISQLAAVLRNSTKLAVSEDGKKVKRLHPVTRCGIEERQACIVVVGNLPKHHCHRNLRLAFSFVGSVKSIRTCQPRLSNNGASSTFRLSKTDNYPAYNEVHAFVEYESVELAEKAAAQLNLAHKLRNGFSVRPFLKQMVHAVVEYESVERAEKAAAQLNLAHKGRKGFNVHPYQKQVLIPRKASNRRIGHKQSSRGLAENDGEVNCEDVSVSASEQNQTWEQNQTETLFSELVAYPMKD